MKIISIMIIIIIIITVACAAEETASITDTVEVRDFSDLAVCESAGLIAARLDRPSIADNRVIHEWAVIDWPSGEVILTADAGKTLNTLGFQQRSFPQWSSDCRFLYYRALHNGEVQIWRLHATSGAREKITTDGADILNFSLTKDGEALVYETSASRDAILAAEAEEYQHGVLIDTDRLFGSAALTKSMPVFGRWASFRKWVGESPGTAKIGHLLSYRTPIYKAISIKVRTVRKATDREIEILTDTAPDWAPPSYFNTIVSPGGHSAAVAMPQEKSLYGDYAYTSVMAIAQRGSPDIRECHDDRCIGKRLYPLKWSEDGGSVYFIAEHRWRLANVYEWTPATDNVRTILETDGLLGAFSSAARKSKSGACPVIDDTAICTAADPANPPRLTAISMASGSVKTVFDPNRDLRRRFSLKVEQVSWRDRLDREITGVLVYPRSFRKGTRYPLVITGDRCPGFLMGGYEDGAPEYALAERGFLVLCIDYNNVVDGFVEAQSRAEARYMGFLAQFDSAIDMLAEQGVADRRRVGVTGWSLGSMGVSYVLTHSDIIQAAALRHLGVFEPAHEIYGPSEFQLRDHGLDGTEAEKEAAYNRISVTRRADRVTAAILVQAADSEYRDSMPAHAALKKYAKPVEMIAFPDETHKLHQPIHEFVNFTRNLDWFRFWLQGYEDPNPEKENQYTRWRIMRDERCAWDEPDDARPAYCEFAEAN